MPSRTLRQEGFATVLDTAQISFSIRDAASLTDVRASLAALHARESAVTSSLEALLASQAELSRDLGRLDDLHNRLVSQAIAFRGLNDALASSADTAAQLSDGVNNLDLEKHNVQQTLHVVDQVTELKACVHGAVGSMGAPQDWEMAATYMARASKIPSTLIRSKFAEDMVPSIEVPNTPWITLGNAREGLCQLFLREFDEAAKEGDSVRVTRVFKLFPLIGCGDVGLDVYGRYVCQGVASAARQMLKGIPGAKEDDELFYARAITKLFEHVALIIDRHRGLVEQHYGEGKMINIIRRLQAEVDVQGGIIIDTWSEERGVSRKVTDIKSYAFSFIAQSFLAPQKGFARLPRMNSLELGSADNSRHSLEDESISMREVDGLLSEIALMLEKWSMYSRFLALQSQTTDVVASAVDLPAPGVVTESGLMKKISSQLIAPYDDMSAFVLRRAVERAFQLDESPFKPNGDSALPLIISAVDDVMYVVSTILQKSILTSQRAVVTPVILNAGRVLSSDFIRMVQRKMDESPSRGIPDDTTTSLAVLSNSLDVASEYLSRITAVYLSPSEKGSGTANNLLTTSFSNSDAVVLASNLTNLELSFSIRTSEVISEKLEMFFNQVIQPSLQSILRDAFRDVNYSLTEAQAAENLRQIEDDGEEEMPDLVQRRFELGWTSLIKPIERWMAPRVFSRLMDIIARYLSKVLERRTWSYSRRISAHGVFRMERDFTGVIGVIARGDYRVRELFTRVTQILMVANMEDEEWEEIVEGDVGMQWVLTDDERRRARNLARE
ncbi:hypothetical protein EKO27_g574 [Xylaria grammica]|uniref:Conserved oligomeric Golgi complex subunit 4 n=1 Tax=Xylaria grammica TaxID=363999 RepID=A0A439DJE2_9PEZI|nr:hypothetical protein EKO27_g574 [Xylaria grammica]